MYQYKVFSDGLLFVCLFFKNMLSEETNTSYTRSDTEGEKKKEKKEETIPAVPLHIHFTYLSTQNMNKQHVSFSNAALLAVFFTLHCVLNVQLYYCLF